MIIATTQKIIDLINGSTIKTKLRQVSELPGRLTDEVINRFVTSSPSVYVAFIGGRESSDGDEAMFAANWAIYVVTAPENDTRVIGPDDILNVIVPQLHGHTIDDVGTLRAARIDNLFSIKKDKKAVRVHALTIRIPNFAFDYPTDVSALDDFITYHAEHSMAPGADEPAAIDEITLSQ